MTSAQTQCLPAHLLKLEPVDSQWKDDRPKLACSTPHSRVNHSLRLISPDSNNTGEDHDGKTNVSQLRSSPGHISLRQSRLNFANSLYRDDDATVAMTGDLEEFHFLIKPESDAKTISGDDHLKSPHTNLKTGSYQGEIEKLSESILSGSCIASPRATKQAVLSTDLSLSDRPVTNEVPRRAKKQADKKLAKGSRNRSVESRPTSVQPVNRPRTRVKAVSLSPKKATPTTTEANEVPGETKGKRQTKLTTYGIRRTARQFQKDQEREREANVLSFLRNNVESGMKVILTEEKGRGVVATRVFHEGEFVVEYAGELIPEKSAKEREVEYKKNPEIGSYMFYFVHGGQKYCVDATKETPRLGRLINHSRLHPNCHVKVIPLDGTPRLVLFARQTINPGEELLYDYGDRDKESLEAHPWLRT